MWYRDRVWTVYPKNIKATDRSSARFLDAYTRTMNVSMTYVSSLEIIDLQKYKVIREAAKVRGSLRDKKNKPFIFVVCKN